ncbi:hypothetical protein [Polynucleobacter sp.]|mgnify:FL=1|uniref:hypothetical protein n=1 Tax=Polynucleobacter sp. TaxID=2029855 RepID=UPI003F69504E
MTELWAIKDFVTDSIDIRTIGNSGIMAEHLFFKNMSIGLVPSLNEVKYYVAKFDLGKLKAVKVEIKEVAP